MDEKEIRKRAVAFAKKHAPDADDGDALVLAEFGAEIAKACYEDAAKYHDGIANDRFCGPEYRRIHERDRDRFRAKAAALGGQK